MTLAEPIKVLKWCPQDAPACITCFNDEDIDVFLQIYGSKVVAVVLR